MNGSRLSSTRFLHSRGEDDDDDERKKDRRKKLPELFLGSLLMVVMAEPAATPASSAHTPQRVKTKHLYRFEYPI